MRKVNTGHLTNCCVVTIGTEKNSVGVVEEGQGSLLVCSGGTGTVLEFPRNVWREGSFQRHGT